MTTEELISKALAGEVICNIGQVDAKSARQLDKLAKSGTLVKWRGYWYPVAGAAYGIGPLKSCWGLASVYAKGA